MVLPEPFTTASPSLVNYDFTDIANGTGYETYYLIVAEDNTGKTYHLTPHKDYSAAAILSVISSTEDHDYDLSPFTIPRTINGDVTVSLAAHGGAATYTAVVEIYRYDGTTETKLGDTVTFAKLMTGAGDMWYFRIPIANEIIPAGQQLRARVSYGIAGATAGGLGVDPAGRTNASFITTTSKISVPYKLDA